MQLHIISDSDPVAQMDFSSHTPEQMVGMLWKAAFVRNASPDAYMSEVARRVAEYSGETVRHDTATNFLADLSAAGLVSIEWNQEQEVI